MPRQWTTSQQQAIEADSSPLLVSAAAGSGKTAVLTERIVRLLLQEAGGVSADRLAVVTFSNAAAEELSQRIGARISELCSEQPGNSHLLRQRVLLQSAFVGTIHAFCLRLVRENFQRLSLPPKVRVLDSGELVSLRQSALLEELESRYHSKERRFLEMVELFASSKNDQPLCDAILHLYDFTRAHPFPQEWIGGQKALYDPEVIPQSPWVEILLKTSLAETESLLKGHDHALSELSEDSVLSGAYTPAFTSDRALLLALSKALGAGDFDAAVELVHEFSFQRLGVAKGYAEDPLKERMQGIRQRCKDRILRLRQGPLSCTLLEAAEDVAWLSPRIETLFSVLEGFSRRFAEKKLARGGLDFADLEQYAVTLLCQRVGEDTLPTPLAMTLAEELDALFVDEYQDVNQVQELIFSTVGARARLFLVGDLKQSIYAFREARPDIFLEKKDRFLPYTGQKGPAVITLGANFRSHRAVCEGVNGVFSHCMSRALGQVDYTREEYLIPAAEFPAHARGQVALHIVDADASKQEKGIVLEARWVAGEIARLLKEGQITRDGTLCPVQPGDIGILLRSPKGRAQWFYKALSALGIPAVAGGDAPFLSTLEVGTLLSVLEAVNNPLLDIPLASAMLSPALSLTESDVARIRLYRREGPLYLAVQTAAEQGDLSAQRVVDLLSALRQLAAEAGILQLTQRLLETTNLLSVVQVLDNGSQRADNLRLFLQYAATYEAAGYRTLPQFLRFLRELQAQGRDLLAANGQKQGAVQIMSVHQSKGLEFPVVFLCDLQKAMNRDDLRAPTLAHRTLGFTCMRRYQETQSRVTTLPLEAARAAARVDQMSEELRILYVAMTRAKERLYLCTSLSNPRKKLQSALFATPREADCFLDWLLQSAYHTGSANNLLEYAELSGETVTTWQAPIFTTEVVERVEWAQEGAPLAAVSKAVEPDAALTKRITGSLEREYGFLAATKAPTKIAVTALTQEALESHPGSRFLRKPSFLAPDAANGLVRGDALHKYMLFANHAMAQKDIAAEIERLQRALFLSGEECALLSLRELQAFYSSALYRRLQTAERVEREYRFLCRIPASEVLGEESLSGERITVQGICDLLFVEAGALYIVDYKTDRVKDPDLLLARYGEQVRLYASVLTKRLSLPIGGMLLYSTALGLEIAVPTPTA